MAVSMTSASVTADRAGAFRFSCRPHLRPEVRVAVHEAIGSATSEELRIDAPGAAIDGITLTLAAPTIVEGTLTNGAGAPVPGMWLYLDEWDFATRTARHGASRLYTITDRSGRYRFTGVRPGGAHVDMLFLAGMPPPYEAGPCEVTAGGTHRVDLTMRVN
jgi:hypothetical protein